VLRKSEQLNDLAKALAAAQGMMEAAKKDKNNPAFGKASKYADLASIWDAVREPLAKNGLSVVQLPFTDEQGRVNMSTLLMHSSGQWIETSYCLLPTKQDPQGYGSAITYMKRYALTGMGVAPEDDDGNAASTMYGSIDPRPPLERPKQAGANGTHGDPNAAALAWVQGSEATIAKLDGDSLVAWEAAQAKAIAKLENDHPGMHARLKTSIRNRYAKLNPLNA
jgi:hypothetical protein